jgi:Protein of unknown function (DUF3455)
MTKRLVCCAALLAACGAAQAAEPLVPPPPGAPLLLEVMVDGVQIYSCDPKGQGFEWRFKAPEANLFDKQGRQIGAHFAGPTWKLSDATIVGEVMSRADAPASGAIPWLLLRTKSHEGSGALAATAFVRRAETQGGVAPSGGCDAAHRGEQARMRYSALYQFFGAAR